ncbi:ATP-binding protein [Pseudoroseomonas globiformis]|uniref:ATP-binding protein n=1 Tax=Teichococcus globiformis TaxID=2307229 RepID=A0ABV7G5P8_9PROT
MGAACLILTSLVIVLGQTIRHHRNAERQLYAAGADMSRRLATASDHIILASLTRLELLSHSDMLREENLAGFSDELRKAQGNIGNWFLLFDRNGRVFINTLRPFGDPSIPSLKTENPEVRNAVEAIIERKHAKIDRLRHAPLAGIEAVLTTQPLATGNGTRLGLLEAIPQSAFISRLPDIQLPSGWLGATMDDWGSIVASKRGSEMAEVGTAQLRDILNATTDQRDGHLVLKRTAFRIQELVFQRSEVTHWISFVIVDRYHPSAIIAALTLGLVLIGMALLYFIDFSLIKLRRNLTTPLGTLQAALHHSLHRQRSSEEDLRAFWSHSADGLFIAARRPEGAVIEMANKALLRMVQPEGIKIQHLSLDTMDAAHAAFLHTCLSKIPPPGDTIQFRHVIGSRAPKLSYDVHLTTVVGHHLQDGTKIFGTVRDVTEAARIRRYLRKIGSLLLSAQDAERRRIARDLHDSTAQIFSGADMFLSRICSADADSAQRLQDARELIAQGQQEIRTLSYLLHPPLLDELGIIAALEWHINRLRRQTGTSIRLISYGDFAAAELPSDCELALFRVSQEALSNAIRHAACTEIRVTLELEGNHVVLTVEDNGRGISTPSREVTSSDQLVEFGVGVYGMSERLRHLDGELLIFPAEPRGTCVRAILPLPLIKPAV